MLRKLEADDFILIPYYHKRHVQLAKKDIKLPWSDFNYFIIYFTNFFTNSLISRPLIRKVKLAFVSLVYMEKTHSTGVYHVIYSYALCIKLVTVLSISVGPTPKRLETRVIIKFRPILAIQEPLTIFHGIKQFFFFF